jgi:hypothetical protein
VRADNGRSNGLYFTQGTIGQPHGDVKVMNQQVENDADVI